MRPRLACLFILCVTAGCSTALMTANEPVQVLASSSERSHPVVPPTRFGVECDGVVLPSPLPQESAEFYPGVGFAMLPMMPIPKAMRGQTMRVRMRHRSDGRFDSVTVSSPVASDYVDHYRARLSEALTDHVAPPAVYRGCAVDRWMEMQMTPGD